MKKRISVWLLILPIVMLACGSDDPEYYPKPRGFMRLEFPERVYHTYEGDCGYSFDIPEYFKVENKEGSCNKDIVINRFNASIYLTYIPVDTNLLMNIEYSQKLVYDHSIKADEIMEARVINDENKAYGMKYNIVGNAASPYQFYVTDSSTHFLRGALYFNAAPNYDSLKPSLEYVLEDVDKMIETVKWNSEIQPLNE
ncbi:gliding motility lipoprotein GldD [Paracrocinitomix mangrovi]|uniref:gliding motility lipoprotein GldD n=1 Tax=Paracrocinitomix mangrovi TaxID=2862509 RepID=UPI001C8E19E9|nr:gliding motility lipoprotein GldD [Paracrocinitomix mangrovi]UKN03816.1 gliding motility lipoprotein GldD [Paracrocinitomix mangrovi]